MTIESTATCQRIAELNSFVAYNMFNVASEVCVLFFWPQPKLISIPKISKERNLEKQSR